MIDSDETLAPWLDRVRACPVVALDTEADSLYSYPERLCLIQIALPDALFLVDPLSGVNLDPLWESLQDVELVIHAADYDLRLLHKGFGFAPSKIFDTMWAARLLGFREFGLHHLVTHFHSVQLEKGSQKADWGKRPLTEKMTEYALNDVRYLLSIHQSLRNTLVEADRLEWVEELGGRLIEDAVQSSETVNEDAWRIKGSSRLDRHGLAILRGLWEWREREACGANKPPYFVLRHDALVEVASLAAAGKRWEHSVPQRFSARRRREMRSEIELAGQMDPEDWPNKKRSVRNPITEKEKDRIEELKNLRDSRAEDLGLDPTLIASKAKLVALARDWDAQMQQMMQWQRRLIST